jgi:hypothetical protein
MPDPSSGMTDRRERGNKNHLLDSDLAISPIPENPSRLNSHTGLGNSIPTGSDETGARAASIEVEIVVLERKGKKDCARSRRGRVNRAREADGSDERAISMGYLGGAGTEEETAARWATPVESERSPSP